MYPRLGTAVLATLGSCSLQLLLVHYATQRSVYKLIVTSNQINSTVHHSQLVQDEEAQPDSYITHRIIRRTFDFWENWRILSASYGPKNTVIVLCVLFYKKIHVSACQSFLSVIVRSRPITSLGHQRKRRVFWEGPKFFKLCPIVSNYV